MGYFKLQFNNAILFIIIEDKGLPFKVVIGGTYTSISITGTEKKNHQSHMRSKMPFWYKVLSFALLKQ